MPYGDIHVKKMIDTTLIFGLGASFYSLLETLWRGYTHWSMALTGGACLLTLYRLEPMLRRRSVVRKAALGSLIITCYEFIVGCVVNLGLGWNVWDYSAQPLNLWGQICLLFSTLWFLLSFPVQLLCRYLHKKLG